MGDHPARQLRVHFCAPAPVQVCRVTGVLFAVPAPFGPRHSPDWTPVIVPSALAFHCWLVPPAQSQMIALVPDAVPEPSASRHLAPYTWSCFPEVSVHCWLVPPLQSHNVTWVPLVCDTLGTSRQRPALVLRSTEVVPPPGPATAKLSNLAVSPCA